MAKSLPPLVLQDGSRPFWGHTGWARSLAFPVTAVMGEPLPIRTFSTFVV